MRSLPLLRSLAGPVMLALLLPSCEAAPGVGPPERVDTSSLDPEVASLLTRLAEKAERAPSDASARGELALAYEVQGMVRAAAVSFEQAARLDPREARWPYGLARTRAEQGDLPGALAAVEEALRRSRAYSPAHWRRGQWLLDLGRVDEAEAAFRSALEIDATSVPARVGLARVNLQRGRPEAALGILEELLREEARLAVLHRLRATALARMGRLQEAREALAQAPPGGTGQPSWSDPWRDEGRRYRVGFAADFQRALARASEGKQEAAVALLERLRLARPHDVTILSNLGAAYLDAGRLEEGIRSLRAALAERPDHFGAHLNLSVAYERQGDLARSLEHARRAVASNPGLSQARVRLGVVLAALGRLEEALAAFEQAHRLDARSAVPLAHAGWMRLRRGRPAEATEDFAAALERDTHSVSAWYGLALARAETGDLDGARAALARAEAIAPGAPQGEAVRKRIEARATGAGGG